MMTSGIFLLAFYLISVVNGQFSPGFRPPVNPQWGGASNFRFQNNPSQQVSNIINAQPLGLSDQQGQQLFNRIAEQVLQTMGSTAQLNNFDSPSGFDQRFGSIQPNQLLPPGAAPLGVVNGNGNVQDFQGSGLPGNGNVDRRNNGPSFRRQPFIEQRPAQQQRSNFFGQPFTERQSPQRPISPIFGRDRQIDISRPQGFNNDFRGENRLPDFTRRPPLRTVDITDRFPDAIPVNPSHIHNPTDGPDPVGRILRRNTRLKERLQAINDNDRGLRSGPEANNIEDIRRENRRLRKMLRQKKRQESKNYKTETKPPPPPPPKKNNNIGSGLLLGALGALILG